MKYVIIGNSAAGVTAAEVIRSTAKKSEITIISDERFGPYCRIFTSSYIAGEITENEMLMRPRNFYDEFKIKHLLGKKVKTLFVKEKKIQIDDGKKISYDKLLIATGATPTFPDIPGIKLSGVFGLRTIEDANAIVKRIAKTKRAIIIGGGLVSCKAAYSLIKRGLKVTIVVASNRLLSQMLDNEASAIVQKKAESLGIEIKFNTDVKEIFGKESVSGVILNDGTKIICELVVVGKGVKPNIDFLKGSGVKVDRGVIVDKYLNTNIPDIFAAGDVAQGWDSLYEDNRINAMWPNAVVQGKIAGLNMAGEKISYEGGYAMNIGEFFGIPAVSFGISRPKEEGFKEVVVNTANKYKKFVLKDDKLVGYINVGDVTGSGFMNNLILSEKDVSEEKFADIKLRRYNIPIALRNQYL
ncbi:MAG: FAD-dependent oxidoreductase [Elusimicrobiota bacterium]